MARSTQSTPKKRPTFQQWSPKFIEALRAHGVVSYAAELAGIDRTTAYKARERNGRFREEWEDALEEATDKLEKEARRRALEASDTLLIFLLKAHRPEKYRERVDVTSAGEKLDIRLSWGDHDDD